MLWRVFHQMLALRDSLTYLAAAAFLLACWLLAGRVSLVLRCRRVVGRVESHEARPIADGSLRYFPVVAFKDALGRFHHVTAPRGRANAMPPKGTVMVVRYADEDPRSAIVCSFLSMWGASMGMALVGLASLCTLAIW